MGLGAELGYESGDLIYAKDEKYGQAESGESKKEDRLCDVHDPAEVECPVFFFLSLSLLRGV